MDKLGPADPKKIGRYALQGVLGEGGMGRVYLGHTPEGRRVAIKVMTERKNSPSSRSRFRHEVDAAKKVRGYYTAQILDSDPDATPPWYASEFIPGPTLKEAVRINGGGLVYNGPDALGRPNSLDVLVRSLFQALSEIHRLGVVHRDLKPENVILGQDGPRLIDFGIAHMEDRTRLTQKGFAVGTLAYACPEQLQAGIPHRGWDIFAFGGLIVYAATGHPPFQRNSEAATVRAILDEDPDLNGVPYYLRDLVRACLNKDPAARRSLEDIRRFLPGKPLEELRGTMWLPTRVERYVKEETRKFQKAPAPQPKPVPKPTPKPVPKPVPKPEPKKPEPASLRGFGIFVTIVLLIGALAGGAGVWFGQDSLQGAIDKLKQLGPQSSPTPKPSPIPSPLPPKPRFTAAKLGKTYYPTAPKAAITVTKIVPSGYNVMLSVVVTGFGKNTDSAFKGACLEIKNGKSTSTLSSDKAVWDDPKSTSTTNRKGSLEFNLHAPGIYTFELNCKTQSKVVGTVIGRNDLKEAGRLEYKNKFYNVAGVHRAGKDVKVILPSFEGHDAGAMCVRTSTGVRIKPSGAKKEAVEKTSFYYVTFKNVAKGSKLYVSCSENSAKKPVFNGTGMPLP